MQYKLPSGKNILIPDETIEQSMKILDLTREEAIQVYLEDEGELENEEQIALDNKAKNFIYAVYDGEKKTTTKTKTVKTSDEKKEIFNEILSFLLENGENVVVLKENKLLQVQINDKIIKIDFIQQRPPK